MSNNYVGQSPKEAPVLTVSQRSVRLALCAQLNHFPRPSESLGHIGGGVLVIIRNTVPSKAHWHVDMLVQRFDGGWEEPDDSGEADFAGGGGHLNFEALEIQTPVTLTLDLQKQTHGDLPY